MKKWYYLMMMLALALVLTACGGNSSNQEESGSENNSTMENTEEDATNEGTADEGTKEEEAAEMAMVTLKDAEGNEVGTAEITEENKGVTINLQTSDLPEGTHGFHIHETGKCEAPDFKSAGGHFNPADVSHGTETEDGPHAGDMENLEVSADGTVDKEIMNEKVTLAEGEDNSLLKEGGTALVIHAGADDMESQPSGDAGDRIACGVIEK
ncbi:superoxide dismutase family protein [Guptibacillus algicola]|uniref:superoxide dismutase family protein n=1 Tax=Guptibacillus algicola TaxID=225844 RepID=UPI001CD71CA2|nr:superoxide dismutase family protein [Alkalihalobacillus algicola]MCA0988566.1 superoxide dismutase family protein [Alkalihalobacillus algicola]